MDSLTEEQQKVWDILSYDIMRDGYKFGCGVPPKAGDIYLDTSTGKTWTFGGLTWIED